MIRVFQILVLFLSTLSAAHAEINRLFVLGDSLSDNGNAYSAGLVPYLGTEPYANGRFSNGPLATEILAENLEVDLRPSGYLANGNLGTNYAVAGAKANGDSPIDLLSQLAALTANNANSITESDLFVIMIGGNDINNAASSDRRTAYYALKKAAINVINTIKTLEKAGAQKFIVVDAPNVAATPLVRSIEDRRIRHKIRYYNRIYNSILNYGLRRLQRSSDSDISVMNLYRYNNEFLRNSPEMGFSNRKDACFVQLESSQQFHPDCDFNEFIYFDAFHPTAEVHRRLGYQLISIAPQ